MWFVTLSCVALSRGCVVLGVFRCVVLSCARFRLVVLCCDVGCCVVMCVALLSVVAFRCVLLRCVVLYCVSLCCVALCCVACYFVVS